MNTCMCSYYKPQTAKHSNILDKIVAMEKKCEVECVSESVMKARMREKMMECGRNGDLGGLYSAIKEYPELLQEIDEIKFIDTALTLVEFDKELVLVKGKDGLTPLHHVAKTHRISDYHIDHDQDTAFHHAAKTLRINDDSYDEERERAQRLLVDLLLKCPNSINILNNKLQTAVHVAAENQNFGAVHLLVNWLITRQRESVLSWKDKDGNTALHIIAAQPNYPEGLPLLEMIVDLVKINKQSKKGETPLDVANAEAVKTVLEKAGGMRGRDIGQKPSMVDYLLRGHSNNCAEFLTRSYYFLIKEMTMEMRNTILVVAVLIATATYQGVLQPPGGLYQAEGGGSTGDTLRLSIVNSTADDQKPPPGAMVMRGRYYNFFMPTNTLAFILSSVIIIFVLPGRLVIIILQASLLFMCLSYLLALFFISEYNLFSTNMLVAACCTIVVAFLLKIAYYIVRGYYTSKAWLCHRLRVNVSNKFGATKFKISNNIKLKIGCHSSQSTRSLDSCPTKMEISVCTRMRKQYKLMEGR